ncbi:uncharacterized protein LOC135495259 [Lineus longissimus]|uniref:uncharacterized protein LOC135495259 n=1 Tax=Lineus longissimus TaxID=88925 RepID=UPI00315CD677
MADSFKKIIGLDAVLATILERLSDDESDSEIIEPERYDDDVIQAVVTKYVEIHNSLQSHHPNHDGTSRDDITQEPNEPSDPDYEPADDSLQDETETEDVADVIPTVEAATGAAPDVDANPVQAPALHPDDVQAPAGNPDDVQAPAGNPDDAQAPAGNPDDAQAPAGNPAAPDAAAPVRGRKRQRDPSSWKRNVRHRNRCAGAEYTTRKGKVVAAKKPLACRCTQNGCRFKCREKVTEEMRGVLCQEYYELANRDQQNSFIVSMVDESTVERHRSRKNVAKKTKGKSCLYHFSFNNEKHRICKMFFLKTLAISNSVVEYALKGKGESGAYVAKDKRLGKATANKISEERIQHVMDHIDRFPRIEPHYCRKDTNAQYLSPELNIRQMYRLYLEYCKEKNINNPVKESLYRKIFVTEFNLRCYVPKKDQCSVCNAYNTATGDDKDELRPNWEAHKKREADSVTEKKEDKRKAKESDDYHAVSFDLEAVLTTPFAGDAQIYYKRKLAVYNFTIYNQATTAGHCYLWDETEGGRGANEIATALLDYLQRLPQEVRHFTSFSDTCGGQNRNQFMAGAMLYAVQKIPNLEVVDLKYMESGHSYLEADSMHATIEGARRHQKVYTTREWEVLIRGARKVNPPYEVNVLKHGNFLNVKEMSSSIIKNRTRNRDGEQVNWLSIKWLRFEKAKPYVIQYKYGIQQDEFMQIMVQADRGRRRSIENTPLGPLYTSRRPITKEKKNDLLDLLRSRVIPSDYRVFYEGLPSTQHGTTVGWEENEET